jgi:hypothetical protein
VNDRGYIEIKPRSPTAGIKEARLLITYSAASSVQYPDSLSLLPTNNAQYRVSSGISPNANTNGPDADPFSGRAYATGGFAGMSGSDSPTNGCALGAIESEESLLIYWFNSTTMHWTGIGKLAESADASAVEWVQFSSGSGWNGYPSGSSNSYFLPYYGYAYSASGVAYYPRMVVVRSDGTAIGLGCPQNGVLPVDVYSGVDFAIVQAIPMLGGNWFSGINPSKNYCILRQMRFGPKAINLERLVDQDTGKQMIALNSDQNVRQAGTIWWDNQR